MLKKIGGEGGVREGERDSSVRCLKQTAKHLTDGLEKK